MSSSFHSIIILSFIIFLAYITNHSRIVELMSFNDNKIQILSNTIDTYETKITKNIARSNQIDTSIAEETTSYNVSFCKEYPVFYKLDYDNSFVDNKKTYVPSIVSTDSGVYSQELNKCVHSTDQDFKDFLDCNQKLTCYNGSIISGKPVFKNRSKSCEYNCIQHFSK